MMPGIKDLRPTDVQQYLQNKGWKPAGEPRNEVLRYEYGMGDRGVVRASVLLDQTFDDYEKRASELLEILATVEKRSIPEVFNDLLLPAADTLQIRVQSDLVRSGAIPLDDSIRLRQGARQMLLAAVHSAIQPRPHFGSLRLPKALDLLRDCREGQTARGSYVTSFLVPIPPMIGSLPLEDPEPLARRATTLLMGASAEASHALAAGVQEKLLEGASRGLSANFLAGLAKLRPVGDNALVEVSMRWSPARAAPRLPSSTVRFPEAVFSTIESAARTLQEKARTTGVELEGFVVRLERRDRKTPPDSGQPGTILLTTATEEMSNPMLVKISLSPDNYRQAIRAHEEGLRVRVIGTLVREGRVPVLQEPSGFEICESESDTLAMFEPEQS
jgi:hypothetical protein